MLKGLRVLAVGTLVLALAVQGGASENIIKFFERNADEYMSQGEWAVYLVKAIAEEDKLPSSAPAIDFIALLEKSRIAPLDGWQHGEYLSFGDKAVTMVQALGLSDQLPADATAIDYVWLLESMGFHEGLPTQLVAKTEALARNINDPIFQEMAGNEYNINISVDSPFVNETR
jgi:hypothetical protein